MASSAADIVKALGLSPHPEGGHYVQTFVDENGQPPHSTAIYYLLQSGEQSHWHRVHGSMEIWHYYAGETIELSLSEDGENLSTIRLGPDILAGERPQVIVPAGCWQSAKCQGDWTLAGCTVAPGFSFENFEMATPGWQPGS